MIPDQIHMSVVRKVVLLNGLDSTTLLVDCIVCLFIDLYKEYVKKRIHNAIAPPKRQSKIRREKRIKLHFCFL